MSNRQPPTGYVFLLGVLVVGTIATAVVAVLLLLSTSLLRSTLSLERSSQALSLASLCAERALLELSKDMEYEGNITLTLAGGTCRALPIGGSGPSGLTLCVQGQSGEVTRRMQIEVQRVFPQVRLQSWREVSSFTGCPSS